VRWLAHRCAAGEMATCRLAAHSRSHLRRHRGLCRVGSRRLQAGFGKVMLPQFNGEFAAHALQRISRLIALFSVLCTAAFWIGLGWKAGGSFVLWSLIAVNNFQWLQFSIQKVVTGLLSGTGKRPRIWHKLLLRYVLLAAVVYVIFKGSSLPVPAFLVGLLLPVLACMCEAVYEVFVAFQHAE